MYKILGALPLNLGRQKTSKIQRDLRQPLNLTANISGRDYDINKRLTAFSITIDSTLKTVKLVVLGSLTQDHQIVFAHFDLLDIDS